MKNFKVILSSICLIWILGLPFEFWSLNFLWEKFAGKNEVLFLFVFSCLISILVAISLQNIGNFLKKFLDKKIRRIL